MSAEQAHPNYVTIWIWLVVLMVAGVLATLLPPIFPVPTFPH